MARTLRLLHQTSDRPGVSGFTEELGTLIFSHKFSHASLAVTCSEQYMVPHKENGASPSLNAEPSTLNPASYILNPHPYTPTP